MSDVAFREKVIWFRGDAPADAIRKAQHLIGEEWCAHIEATYAAAHPPRATPESVLRELDDVLPEAWMTPKWDLYRYADFVSQAQEQGDEPANLFILAAMVASLRNRPAFDVEAVAVARKFAELDRTCTDDFWDAYKESAGVTTEDLEAILRRFAGGGA